MGLSQPKAGIWRAISATQSQTFQGGGVSYPKGGGYGQLAEAPAAPLLRSLSMGDGLFSWEVPARPPLPLPPTLLIPAAQGRGPGALTGVGAASTEIQALEGTAVAGVQGRGAGKVELVQGHGAVEDVLREAGPWRLT